MFLHGCLETGQTHLVVFFSFSVAFPSLHRLSRLFFFVNFVKNSFIDGIVCVWFTFCMHISGALFVNLLLFPDTTCQFCSPVCRILAFIRVSFVFCQSSWFQYLAMKFCAILLGDWRSRYWTCIETSGWCTSSYRLPRVVVQYFVRDMRWLINWCYHLVFRQYVPLPGLVSHSFVLFRLWFRHKSWQAFHCRLERYFRSYSHPLWRYPSQRIWFWTDKRLLISYLLAPRSPNIMTQSLAFAVCKWTRVVQGGIAVFN